MPRVTTDKIQAWLEPTKLTLIAPDLDLLEHLEEEVLVRLSAVADISNWVSPETTPRIVQVIITKIYAAWHIDRQYSENQDENSEYATRLKENANMLIEGILEGIIKVPGQDLLGRASFYPNDSSSAMKPTRDNPSLGGPWFSLGKSF